MLLLLLAVVQAVQLAWHGGMDRVHTLQELSVTYCNSVCWQLDTYCDVCGPCIAMHAMYRKVMCVWGHATPYRQPYHTYVVMCVRRHAGTEEVTEVPTHWGIHEDVYCAVWLPAHSHGIHVCMMTSLLLLLPLYGMQVLCAAKSAAWPTMCVGMRHITR